MMEKIREGLWYIKIKLSTIFSERKSLGIQDYAPVKLRGNIRSVIVVKPDDPMFDQAVFILNEDYIRHRDEPARELMRQAKEAAAGCTQSYLPAKRRRGGKIFRGLAVLGFAAALGFICFYLK